jgi:hypothetical protein
MRMLYRCKRMKGDPLNNMKKDSYVIWRFIFILSFEIEYRTIRTIKRDTNSELGWIQVLIEYLS